MKKHGKYYDIKLRLRVIKNNYNSNGFNEWDELDYQEQLDYIKEQLDLDTYNCYIKYIKEHL